MIPCPHALGLRPVLSHEGCIAGQPQPKVACSCLRIKAGRCVRITQQQSFSAKHSARLNL